MAAYEDFSDQIAPPANASVPDLSDSLPPPAAAAPDAPDLTANLAPPTTVPTQDQRYERAAALGYSTPAPAAPTPEPVPDLSADLPPPNNTPEPAAPAEPNPNATPQDAYFQYGASFGIDPLTDTFAEREGQQRFSDAIKPYEQAAAFDYGARAQYIDGIAGVGTDYRPADARIGEQPSERRVDFGIDPNAPGQYGIFREPIRWAEDAINDRTNPIGQLIEDKWQAGNRVGTDLMARYEDTEADKQRFIEQGDYGAAIGRGIRNNVENFGAGAGAAAQVVPGIGWVGDRIRQAAGAARSFLPDDGDRGDVFNFTPRSTGTYNPLNDVTDAMAPALRRAYETGGWAAVQTRLGQAWEEGEQLGYSDNPLKDIGYRFALDPLNFVGVGTGTNAARAGGQGGRLLGPVADLFSAPLKMGELVAGGNKVGGTLAVAGALFPMAAFLTDKEGQPLSGANAPFVAALQSLPAEWQAAGALGSSGLFAIAGGLAGRVPLGAAGRLIGGRGTAMVAANGGELVRPGTDGVLRLASEPNAKAGVDGVRLARPDEFYRPSTTIVTAGGAATEQAALARFKAVLPTIQVATGDAPAKNSALLAALADIPTANPQAIAARLARIPDVSIDPAVLAVPENRQGLAYLAGMLDDRMTGLTREQRIDALNALQARGAADLNGLPSGTLWSDLERLTQNYVQKQLGRGSPETATLFGRTVNVPARFTALARELPVNGVASAAIKAAFDGMGKRGEALWAAVRNPAATVGKANSITDFQGSRQAIRDMQQAIQVAERAMAGGKTTLPFALDPALRRLNDNPVASPIAYAKQVPTAFWLSTPGYFVRNFLYTAPLTALRTLGPNRDIGSLWLPRLEQEITSLFGPDYWRAMKGAADARGGTGEMTSARQMYGWMQAMGEMTSQAMPPAARLVGQAAFSGPGRTAIGAAYGFAAGGDTLQERTDSALKFGGLIGAGPLVGKLPIFKDSYWMLVNHGSQMKALGRQGWGPEYVAEIKRAYPGLTDAQARAAANAALLRRMAGSTDGWWTQGDASLLPDDTASYLLSVAKNAPGREPAGFLPALRAKIEADAAAVGVALDPIPGLSPRGLIGAPGPAVVRGTGFDITGRGPLDSPDRPVRPTPPRGPAGLLPEGEPFTPDAAFRQRAMATPADMLTDRGTTPFTPDAAFGQLRVNGQDYAPTGVPRYPNSPISTSQLVPDAVIEAARQPATPPTAAEMMRLLADVQRRQASAKSDYAGQAKAVKDAAGEPGRAGGSYDPWRETTAILQAESGLTKSGGSRKFYDLNAIGSIIRNGTPERQAQAFGFLSAYRAFLDGYDVVRLPKGPGDKTAPVATVPKGTAGRPTSAADLPAYLQAVAENRMDAVRAAASRDVFARNGQTPDAPPRIASGDYESNPVVMKGMSRALGEDGGIPLPNDQGVIFATFSPRVAEKYADFSLTSENRDVLRFRYRADAKIANLEDVAAVTRIVDRLDGHPAWQGEDLADPAVRQRLVREIVESPEGMRELTIMDEPAFVETLLDMGFDGARGYSGKPGDYDIVFINPDVVLPFDRPSPSTTTLNANPAILAPAIGALGGAYGGSGTDDPNDVLRGAAAGFGLGAAALGGTIALRSAGRLRQPSAAAAVTRAGIDPATVTARTTPSIPPDVMSLSMMRLSPVLDDLEQSSLRLESLLRKAKAEPTGSLSMRDDVALRAQSAPPRPNGATGGDYVAFQDRSGGWTYANQATGNKLGSQRTEYQARAAAEALNRQKGSTPLTDEQRAQAGRDVADQMRAEGKDPNAPVPAGPPRRDPLQRPDIQAEIARSEALAAQLRQAQDEVLGQSAIPVDVARRIAAQYPNPARPGWTLDDGTPYIGTDPALQPDGSYRTAAGRTVTFRNSMDYLFAPPDRDLFVRNHYEDIYQQGARFLASVQGATVDGVGVPRLSPAQEKQVAQRVADRAYREGQTHARSVMLGYDDRSVGQMALDMLTPYSYFSMQAMAQSARYMATHPGQLAVLLDGIVRWAEATKNLPNSQKWTWYGYTDGEGNEVRFNPLALLSPLGSPLQMVTPSPRGNRPKDWIEEIGRLTGTGGLNLSLDLARNAVGRATGLKGGLLPSAPTEAQFTTSQGRLANQLTGGRFNPEAPLMDAIYGNSRVGQDDYYTGLALQMLVRDGQATEADAKAAILSYRAGTPNALWQRAYQQGLADQAGKSGGMARFVGAPVQVWTNDRNFSDQTNEAFQALIRSGATSDQIAAFLKANPSQSTRGDMSNDPRQLRLELANQAYYRDKDAIDAKYQAILADLSKQWETGKITGTWWQQMRGNTYDQRAQEYEALKAKHPDADIDASKGKALREQLDRDRAANAWQPDPLTQLMDQANAMIAGGAQPQRTERAEAFGYTNDPAKAQQAREGAQRALVSGYFDIRSDDPKYQKNGATDFKAYQADRQAYLDRLTPEQREYVLNETKKNQTLADKWYETQIAPRMDRYFSMPAYSGGTPGQQERWAAADKTYNDAFRAAKDAGKSDNDAGDAARAALDNAGFSYYQDYRLGQAYESQDKKRAWAADDNRLLREFYGNSAPATYTPPRDRYSDTPSPEEAVKRDQIRDEYFALRDKGVAARTVTAQLTQKYGASFQKAMDTYITVAASQGATSGTAPGASGRAVGSGAAAGLGTARATGGTARPAVATNFDGSPLTLSGFWDEYNRLKDTDRNAANKLLATNWDSLKAGGATLTGEKPTYRTDAQQRAYDERGRILDEYGRLKATDPRAASQYYATNKARLDALDAIATGQPAPVAATTAPRTTTPATSTRSGGSIQVPRSGGGGGGGGAPRSSGGGGARPSPPAATLGTDPAARDLVHFLRNGGQRPDLASLLALRRRYSLGVNPTASIDVWLAAARRVLNVAA